MEVEVETNNKNKFNMIDGQYIKPIKSEWITEKNEIETLLLQRKKRHLQQMAMEKVPPSHKYFKELLINKGNSVTVSKIFKGEVTHKLNSFPTVICAWLQ
jgi:hypothetical protein